MEKPSEIVRWAVAWGNPYTSPPDGGPRLLRQVDLPRGVKPEEHMEIPAPGNGYSLCFMGVVNGKPPRRMSEAQKQAMRRRNLERRMRRNNPLFADMAISAAYAKSPVYYGVPQAESSPCDLTQIDVSVPSQFSA